MNATSPPSDAVPSSAAAAQLVTPGVDAPIRGARKSTVVVMVSTLLTKVIGLVREIATAGIFGNGGLFSAFVVAFQIPNVIRTFVADQALVSAVVPVFTRLRVDGDEERAWRVASAVMSILMILLVPLTVLAMVGARFFIDIAVNDHFNRFPLAIELFRILIPVVVIMSIAGVIIGTLNSYGSFAPGSWAQLAFNIVSVGLLLGITPLLHTSHARIVFFAWSITIATLVQAVLPWPWLRRFEHGADGNQRYRLRFGGAFRDPMVRVIVVAMLPVMLSLAMMNLNNIVNTYWSSRIPLDQLRGVRDGGPAAVYKAWGVFQLPQGIFSLAVATVFFPLFARHSARSDHAGFRDAVAAGIRQIAVLLLPASLFLIVFAEPVSRLLFQHGGTTNAQALLIASALRGFGVGLVANGAIQLLMRAFFSLHMPWRPAVIGFFANFLANILLGGLLHVRYGVFGVTLGMALANTCSFLVMWYVLRRHLGRMPLWPVLRDLLVAGCASALTVGAGWLVWRGIMSSLGAGLMVDLLAMLVAIAVTWGLYGIIALRLRLVNAPQLRRLLKRG